VWNVSPNTGVERQDYDPGDPFAGRLETSFVQSTRTNKLWAMSGWSATGVGVGVAVVDTGINGDLVDFQTAPNNPTSRVVASAVVNPAATNDLDGYGHGTHVAGLIAGNGFDRKRRDPLFGSYVGTAPAANLVSIKASDDHGDATVLDVIYGVQFAVDHQADYNIKVLNLSLRSATAQSYTTDPLDAAVESAWFHGITVVTSAGNLGSASDAVNYAPGNDPYVISVGAVDDQGTKKINDDQLTSWSSYGTTQDGFTKPDVLAPGAHITSTLAPGSDFASLCSTCVTPDGQYFTVGGTSMAAAVVSGIVADVVQVHPDYSPNQVKAILRAASRNVKGVGVEVAADYAVIANPNEIAPANSGLTPNQLVDPASGDIDYTRAGWSRAGWSSTDPTHAGWSHAGWSRAGWSCATCSSDVDPTTVDPSLAGWSHAGWSHAGWSTSFDK
jgi:serine protease AprX